jgi:SWI/SNF-related matrix-associated actin-dependent regulator 1 of chromatin subfamily A
MGQKMILDYVRSTRKFKLTIERGEADPQKIMREQGWDWWQEGSMGDRAVLVCSEPYAASAYGNYATSKAMGEIRTIVDAVAQSRADTTPAQIKCPADQELMPFQRASVSYALQRQNCIVGDQPGLGKTPIAICFANEISAKRVLVICPASIRRQWVERIRAWTTMRWPYTVYAIEAGRHGVHPTAQWTVVSYELARHPAIGRALARGSYDLLIVDEAHYVKTTDSGRTRAIFGGGENPQFEALASRCDRVLALTGTPLPNRPRECYTLARALCWDGIDWMSEDKFRQRFNPGGRFEGTRSDGTSYFYSREEVGRSGELQMRLRANMLVRHLKRDVLKQLKLPRYDIIRVDETGVVRAALEAERLLDIDPDTVVTGDIDILGHLSVVRRQMGVAIAPQVADYAQMLFEGGEEKIVIFAWHLEVLDILQKRLEKFGCLRIDGSTSAAGKAKRVAAFREDPSKHFMIGNTLSLGTGTDGLQDVSARALLAEPEWVPGNNEQAVDRLNRIGQARTVLADFFVAPGSLLEKILADALHKAQNVHRALDEVA